MADNVSVPSGSGNIIASDEVVDGTLGTVKVQYIKLMDGTLDGTTKSTIKAASTAPVATDTALVVALSPNSSLATSSVKITDGTNIASFKNTSPVGADVGLITRDLLFDSVGGSLSSSVVPAAGSYGAQFALNVNVNAQQKPTYHFVFKPSATALTANIARPWVMLCHSGSVGKMARIRRITAFPFSNTVLSAITMELSYLTSGSGAPITTIGKPDSADANATTIGSSAVVGAITGSLTSLGATNMYLVPIMTASAQGLVGPLLIYDWQENGETKPFLIRPGIQEGWVLNVTALTTTTLGMNVNVILTEE